MPLAARAELIFWSPMKSMITGLALPSSVFSERHQLASKPGPPSTW